MIPTTVITLEPVTPHTSQIPQLDTPSLIQRAPSSSRTASNPRPDILTKSPVSRLLLDDSENMNETVDVPEPALGEGCRQKFLSVKLQGYLRIRHILDLIAISLILLGIRMIRMLTVINFLISIKRLLLPLLQELSLKHMLKLLQMKIGVMQYVERLTLLKSKVLGLWKHYLQERRLLVVNGFSHLSIGPMVHLNDTKHVLWSSEITKLKESIIRKHLHQCAKW